MTAGDMGKMDIAFPNLNIYLSNVPKSFEVFGFTIALYGVIIGMGFLLALFLIAKVARKTDQDPDIYWDLAVYVIIFSIIGARLYYVIFSWDSYKDDLLSILAIRNGGLAIYGGVIAGFTTIYIFSRVKKCKFLRLADTVMPGLLLGQAIGRWGNFTNREVFGEYTNGLLAMRQIKQKPYFVLRKNSSTYFNPIQDATVSPMTFFRVSSETPAFFNFIS